MRRQSRSKRHFDNRHSRWVRRLKVILPILALAILSTLFLVADRRGVGTLGRVDPADYDRLLTEGRVANAAYSGVGQDGAAVRFTAAEARPDGEDAAAERLVGTWTASDGREVSLRGDRGYMTGTSGDMRVEGDVVVQDAAGYTLSSEALDIEGASKDIVSPGPVEGTGPGLSIAAGAMRVSQDATGPRTTFTGGVRVIYDARPTN